MSSKISGLGNAEGKGAQSSSSSDGTTRKGPTLSLSRLQTFVSLAAGILSIAGALVAIPNYFKLAHGKGELVALVQDGKTEKILSDATIEVLTPQGTVVTTLTPDSFGKASCALEEGRFRVRVSHPGFSSEVRDVQVTPGGSTQVRVQLRASSSVPRTIRRFFGR